MCRPGRQTAASWRLSAISRTRPRLSKLPIEEVLEQIRESLEHHHELVLEAPPGAGKTTLVPLALLDQPWRQGKIMMLEPRRMAARAAAERMASMLGESVGERIGYRIRQDTQVGPNTLVEVVTGGVLTRLLQDDPALEHYSAVIFDEFHERNLDSDLGLALALHGRALLRDEDNPLRIVVMSATLDGERISALLHNAPLVRSEGRMHNVSIRYLGGGQRSDLVPEVTAATVQAHTESDGNILVFLPGQKEITSVAQNLTRQLPTTTKVAPLYGQLSLAQQRAAIAPLNADDQVNRKVVLATDIAETSLTIEGITVVVDSGYRREPRFDPRTGLTRLQSSRISKASASQRAGRAGRLAPGQCWRLWRSEDVLQAYAAAEIEQADLMPLALQMLNFGVAQIDELTWLTPPPKGAFKQALTLLQSLGAVTGCDGHTQLTDHGREMASFPAHPRLAHMLLVGARYGLGQLACTLAAALAEPSRPQSMGHDVEQWPHAVDRSGKSCQWSQRVKRQAAQFKQALIPFISQPSAHEPPAVTPCGFLLAQAYPDRIAKQRDASAEYQLSNGRSARLPADDHLHKTAWLAVAESGGVVGTKEDRIYCAAELDPTLFREALADHVNEVRAISWHEQNQRLLAERQYYVGALLLRAERINDLTAEQKSAAIADFIRAKGLGMLPWTSSSEQWRARVQLLAAQTSCQSADLPAWPDVTDTGLMQTLEHWLYPYLTDVTNLQDLKKLDLLNMLQSLLPWPLPQKLDQWAPTHLAVPSGSQKAIDYTHSPPVLAVKLQEMFGCETTPCVANGSVPLVVHLLSPAQRPLQVTQDLAGFWRSSYQEVKKEMKGRYPKHPWPDDPTQAVATRGGKKKREA